MILSRPFFCSVRNIHTHTQIQNADGMESHWQHGEDSEWERFEVRRYVLAAVRRSRWHQIHCCSWKFPPFQTWVSPFSHFFPPRFFPLLSPSLSILSSSLLPSSFTFHFLPSLMPLTLYTDKHIHAHTSLPTLGVTTAAARLWGTGSFQRNNRTERRASAISRLPFLLLIAALPFCGGWRRSMSDQIALYLSSLCHCSSLCWRLIHGGV